MTTLEDQVVLKHDELFVVCDEDGDITAAAIGAGLYFRDMRHLSTLALRLQGCRLELLSSGTDAIDHLEVYLTNAERLPAQEVLPQTLTVIRRREMDGALCERVTVTNHNRTPVTLTLQTTFGSDFRDLFDIRGLWMNRETQPQLPRRNEGGYLLVYEAFDGSRFFTHVEALPPPSRMEVHADAAAADAADDVAVTTVPGHDRFVSAPAHAVEPVLLLCHDLQLGPGGSGTIEYRIQPEVIAAESRPERPRRTARERDRERDWRGSEIARITTDNQVFNEVLRRSLSDLTTLITPLPSGDAVIAAGIPWYVAPFGRDSLIAGRQLLPFNQGIVAATLRYLAAKQGRDDDPWRDEQPGKIVHEIRYGEMARRNLIPHSRYYGTVDATPLFVLLLADYLDWTDDRALYEELRPNIERALEWIDFWGDSNRDGLVDFGRRSERGLANQGWKDSDNSLQRPDGLPIPNPVALIEVQGYVYAAKSRLATHAARYGDTGLADWLRTDAEALRAQVEERYWLEESGYYAEAIDGEGRRCESVSSNPAHLLSGGLPSAARAMAVVERLRQEDLFSGWGIRTLSSRMPHYNPVSYHNGSVWPHDNGWILWGLRRYGMFEALEELATALFEAATRFPYLRLPELMCGFARGGGPRDIPVQYPVSCSPQAWAAGVPYVIIETLLGLRADASRHEIALDPWLPGWLQWIELRGLCLGGATLDLRVAGRRREADVRVLDNPHDVRIVIAGAPS